MTGSRERMKKNTDRDVNLMRERITDEIFLALGQKKDGWMRRWLGWLFRQPTQNFARIFARADQAVAQGGMSAGCRSVMADLDVSLQVSGQEHIPTHGPVLIVANHPGAYDSVAIGSCVRRQDLRIIVYETGFYHALPNIDPWFIYATNEPAGRMLALRTAIQHLQTGGCVLQFGSGTIEPDPSLVSDAQRALDSWSRSVEIMLRKAPDTLLVLAIASGVLLKRFARHPLTYLRRGAVNRRRLAEFTQVITQLLSPRKVQARARVSFAAPVSTAVLASESRDGRWMGPILERARMLLAAHMREFSDPSPA